MESYKIFILSSYTYNNKILFYFFHINIGDRKSSYEKNLLNWKVTLSAFSLPHLQFNPTDKEKINYIYKKRKKAFAPEISRGLPSTQVNRHAKHELCLSSNPSSSCNTFDLM